MARPVLHFMCGITIHLWSKGSGGKLNNSTSITCRTYFKISRNSKSNKKPIYCISELAPTPNILYFQIVLGSVKIASSRVESVDEIRNRLQQVLTVVPAERLIVAPDCGLGFLPTELAKQKLCNMVQAAKSLP